MESIIFEKTRDNIYSDVMKVTKILIKIGYQALICEYDDYYTVRYAYPAKKAQELGTPYFMIGVIEE